MSALRDVRQGSEVEFPPCLTAHATSRAALSRSLHTIDAGKIGRAGVSPAVSAR